MGSPRVGSNPTGVVLIVCARCENSEPPSWFQTMTLAGLEPAIFGSEDQRLIHWATGPRA